MASIAVSCLDQATSIAYAEILDALAVPYWFLPASCNGRPPSGGIAEGMAALFVGGTGDLHQQRHGEPGTSQARALEQALARNIPVLAIGAGMQLLNLVFGGALLDELPGHIPENGQGGVGYHQIYVSPGSKLSAILGPGGFFRVNSMHHRGLRDPQRSPRLLTSAYSLEDGVVEGLESPAHDWVIGVQFQPERSTEVPRAFRYLFAAFVERAELS